MRKNTLIILAGISGSGKSTFANLLEQGGFERVCPDLIRKQLYGNESIQGNGKEVFEKAFWELDLLGNQDCDVVFDATNTTKKARKQVIEKARPHFDFILCYYFYPSLVKSLTNMQKRERKVPREILAKQMAQWETPTFDEGFDYICELKTNYL